MSGVRPGSGRGESACQVRPPKLANSIPQWVNNSNGYATPVFCPSEPVLAGATLLTCGGEEAVRGETLVAVLLSQPAAIRQHAPAAVMIPRSSGRSRAALPAVWQPSGEPAQIARAPRTLAASGAVVIQDAVAMRTLAAKAPTSPRARVGVSFSCSTSSPSTTGTTG